MREVVVLTGGAGYIGSHTLVALIEAGYRPVVLDNLCNSSIKALQRVEEITGCRVHFVQGDVRDRSVLDGIFAQASQEGAPVHAVVHFAGLKSVSESVSQPLRYYDTNVAGTVTLLNAMRDAGVKRLVFSSSATVYDPDNNPPYVETDPLGPINPYGQTKAMVEQILRDTCAADPTFSAVALRYFNPIGAHPSGLIGEDPRGTPANLFPFVTQVAIGRRPCLSIYGNDYATADGTGVRDYVHVLDLADGHVKALVHTGQASGFLPLNLGTGAGTTVLQVIHAFETTIGRSLPYRFEARRPGDPAASWADPTQACKTLGWKAVRTIAHMCEDGWRWQTRNPEGYQ